MNNSTQRKRVCFYVNEDGWILLFQRLGKTIIRFCKHSKIKRISSKSSQHRYFEIECEGGTMIMSKLFDTSKFWE